MTKRQRELADVTVQLHHETAKAILVSTDGDRDNAVWLPLSQLEIAERHAGGRLDITLPTWLATDKGLI